MNAFFDSLSQRWVEAAKRRGIDIEPPSLDAATADQLLDLARLAAHTQERRFAPLASFTAGVAAERFERAGGEDVAALIADVCRALEANSN